MKPWSKDEKDILFYMRSQGQPWSVVARAVGRTEKACKQFYGRQTTDLKKTERKDELASKIAALKEKGYTEIEIAGELGISRNYVYIIKRLYGIKSDTKDKIMVARRKAERGEKKKFHCKHTICWTCKNAVVNCKKPVEGFVAKKIPFYGYSGVKDSYVVSECPNYEPEPWMKKYKKWGRDGELQTGKELPIRNPTP